MTLESETEEKFSLNRGKSSSEDDSKSAQSNSTRLLSCFRRGFVIILASVIKGIPLPQGCFISDFSLVPG